MSKAEYKIVDVAAIELEARRLRSEAVAKMSRDLGKWLLARLHISGRPTATRAQSV